MKKLASLIVAMIDYFKTQNMDIPDGTITTQPYFNDLLIAVAMK